MLCIFLSILLNIFFVYRYDIIPKLLLKISSTSEIQNERSSAYVGFVDFYNKVEYTDKIDILFLGDSLTERCDFHLLFQEYNVAQQGISGDTTDGLLERIDAAIRSNPDKIVIEIGTNDVLNKIPVDTALENYSVILEELRFELPNTDIFVESVYPITEAYLEKNDVTADLIVDFNEKLQVLADNYDATYIDIYSSLVDEDGFLKEDMSSDGLHLNGFVYFKIADIINSYLK